MLFGFGFGRSVELKDYLRQTKKIKVNGIKFEIKKLNLDDHLAGLNVILKMRDLYKKEKPTDPAVVIEDAGKMKKFMRDFLYAGVAYPKLSLKDPVEDGCIAVDELLNDIELAQKLTFLIIAYAYGKKKLSTSI